MCNYDYQVCVPAFKASIKEDGRERTADHGLAVISRYPILESESALLEKHPDDHQQVLVLISKLNIGGRITHICNVHFENNDLAAERHLFQTLEIINEKKIFPIILGDFNLYNLSKYKNILSDYKLSTTEDNYISYPEDQGTLDYVVIPTSLYDFSRVTCSKKYVSDHRAVIAN